MLGFAILMNGMQMMSGAVSPLRESPVFIDMLTMFSNISVYRSLTDHTKHDTDYSNYC